MYLTQASTRKSEQNATFAKAIEALADATPSRRATGISMLTQMAIPSGMPDRRYFHSTVETLCSYVRFERDLYCRDAAFNALRQLNADDADAMQTLYRNLLDDLTRHIAKFAVTQCLNVDTDVNDLLTTAPEAQTVIKDSLPKVRSDLNKQLAFAKSFPPTGDRLSQAWSIRLDARDLARRRSTPLQ